MDPGFACILLSRLNRIDMRLPYLRFSYLSEDYRAFVDFWRQLYRPNEKTLPLYLNNIDKKRFTSSDIADLFRWKNGMEYKRNVTKRKSVQLVQHNLELVNQLKQNFDEELFQETFGQMGAIWQIFLLHLIDPNHFPIFDQHVYRTHLFLMHGEIRPIPSYKKTKLDYYQSVYLPFFNQVCRRHRIDRFHLDNALWTLGRFLLQPEANTTTEGRAKSRKRRKQ